MVLPRSAQLAASLILLFVHQSKGLGGISTARTTSAGTVPRTAATGPSSFIFEAKFLLRGDKSFPAPVLRRRTLLDERRQRRPTALAPEPRRRALGRQRYGKRDQVKEDGIAKMPRYVALALAAIVTVTLLSIRSVTASYLPAERLSILIPIT